MPTETAYLIHDGPVAWRMLRPERLVFPIFDISSNPEIPLTQILERRFDLIERATDTANIGHLIHDDNPLGGLQIRRVHSPLFKIGPVTRVPMRTASLRNEQADSDTPHPDDTEN